MLRDDEDQCCWAIYIDGDVARQHTNGQGSSCSKNKSAKLLTDGGQLRVTLEVILVYHVTLKRKTNVTVYTQKADVVALLDY